MSTLQGERPRDAPFSLGLRKGGMIGGVDLPSAGTISFLFLAFTEGFATADLLEAQDLLAAAAAGPAEEET